MQTGLENALSEVLTDWVDADEERLPGGAESDAYLLMQPPYRAANQAMVMLEELKLLEGFQQIAYEPWLLIKTTATTLPSVTTVNVNTASKQVLLALSDVLSETEVDTWIQLRAESPAKDTAEFRSFVEQQTGQTAVDITKWFPDWLISVRSNYFLLAGQVDYGESQQGLSAIFYRPEKDSVQLVQRWLSNPQGQ